jgi:hypothetical protein
MVRLATSTDCAIRETVPVNVCPGYAVTVNVNDVPFVTLAVYASGTGLTSRNRSLSTTLVGLDRLLRQDHIIARDDTRSGGGCFQLVVRAGGRLGFRTDRRELRLGTLQFGLRLGLLRDQFGRLEGGELLARADARTAIHGDRLHEARHARIQRDGLIGRQLARERQRHLERLFNHLDHFDRLRSRRRGLLRRLGGHCRGQ